MPDPSTDFPSRPHDGAEKLRIVLPATASSVSAMRSHARDFAARVGAEEQVVADVALAISEAATNAVLHGYREVEGETVVLRGRHEDGWVELEVADHGDGFRPSPSGGLGFGLKVMADVSDSMTIEQRDTGTAVVLRFALVREPRA